MSSRDPETRPTTVEDAVELYLEQRREGSQVGPAAFAAQHPDLGPDLASVLEALSALESATQDERMPDRIGAFRVVREIGRGGMCVELARHNIQVNGIAPGYFKTEMTKALVEDEAFTAWLCKRTPLPHITARSLRYRLCHVFRRLAVVRCRLIACRARH